MRKNDMPVIICKLLAYLYDCMKKGKEPERDVLEYDGVVFAGIPQRYRAMVVHEVVERGLVTGMGVTSYDDELNVVITEPQVTLAGVEYLFENKTMARALAVLKELKEPLSFIAGLML